MTVATAATVLVGLVIIVVLAAIQRHKQTNKLSTITFQLIYQL